MSNIHSPETTYQGGDEGGGGGGGGEFMLFGVRVVVDSMRKSVSLNNLSQYEHRLDIEKDVAGKPTGDFVGGYASADDVPRRSSSGTATAAINRERKRGIPWTEEEHKRFLLGLEKVGKGDWRGISRTFVKTRTPTQVASHAQKYFLRRANLNRRRRRSSLFDITTHSVGVGTNDQRSKENITREAETRQQVAAAELIAVNPEMSNVKFTMSAPSSSIYNTWTPQAVATPATSDKSTADFNVNTNTSPLSLNLSLFLSPEVAKTSRSSTFQFVQGFSNPDGMIGMA